MLSHLGLLVKYPEVTGTHKDVIVDVSNHPQLTPSTLHCIVLFSQPVVPFCTRRNPWYLTNTYSTKSPCSMQPAGKYFSKYNPPVICPDHSRFVPKPMPPFARNIYLEVSPDVFPTCVWFQPLKNPHQLWNRDNVINKSPVLGKKCCFLALIWFFLHSRDQVRHRWFWSCPKIIRSSPENTAGHWCCRQRQWAANSRHVGTVWQL